MTSDGNREATIRLKLALRIPMLANSEVSKKVVLSHLLKAAGSGQVEDRARTKAVRLHSIEILCLQ